MAHAETWSEECHIRYEALTVDVKVPMQDTIAESLESKDTL